MVSVCLPSDALLHHLPSYLGFSHLGMGYLFMAAPAKHSCCSLPWMRGISLPPPFLTFNVVLFIIGDWNAKVGSQKTPGVTSQFGLGMRSEAGQRQIEFCQENALVLANTLFPQHKRRLYTWASPDGQHKNQIDYVLCSKIWRSSIQTKKKKKDQEQNVAQIMTPYCQIQT